jgi:hypothetical protein
MTATKHFSGENVKSIINEEYYNQLFYLLLLFFLLKKLIVLLRTPSCNYWSFYLV